jgi:hypothetical protein
MRSSSACSELVLQSIRDNASLKILDSTAITEATDSEKAWFKLGLVKVGEHPELSLR